MKGNVKSVDWKGCGTALVTPFDEKGRIDFGALEELVDWQITQGIDFLVPCGTTGESATLSGDERKAVTAAVVRGRNGRVPVIAGAGGNHTARAVFWAATPRPPARTASSRSRRCTTSRAPTASCATSRRSRRRRDLPILVYNVPGRTGSDLDVDTILRLAEIPRVVGLKEASPNFGKIARLMTVLPGDFAVFSGEDSTALAA